jgi:hypothetical protein
VPNGEYFGIHILLFLFLLDYEPRYDFNDDENDQSLGVSFALKYFRGDEDIPLFHYFVSLS